MGRTGTIGPRVVSLGYEGRTLDEFVAILRHHGVVKVLDVRALPLSHKKGFSKTPLSERLATEGIEYCHLKMAGNPHKHRRGNIQVCLGLYAKYLTKKSEVIQMIQREIGQGLVAVMCFEKMHEHCHRSVLLQALRDTGSRITVLRA